MNWFYRVNGQVITRVVSRGICVFTLAAGKAINFPSFIHQRICQIYNSFK
jgi:hypothetical protein